MLMTREQIITYLKTRSKEHGELISRLRQIKEFGMMECQIIRKDTCDEILKVIEADHDDPLGFVPEYENGKPDSVEVDEVVINENVDVEIIQ